MSKGPLIRILGALRNEPWAIRASALDEMIRLAERREVEIEAMRPAPLPHALSRQMERETWETPKPYVRDGVMVIPVVGPLFAYASWLNDLCGAMSYDMLAQAFNDGLNNPKVRAILFVHDSPGGQVTGCGEFADMIFRARGTKPIVNYVNGSCCSASYWVAAPGDGIVVAPTAMVGCLGVAGSIRDTSEAEKKIGIRTIEIVSTQTPHKRPDPKTDEGFAQLLRMIDSTAEVFLGDVAKYRGVDRKAVDSRFGKGAVFVGAEAVAAGLADDVGTFEDVLATLVDAASD